MDREEIQISNIIQGRLESRGIEHCSDLLMSMTNDVNIYIRKLIEEEKDEN